jgi:hypothetical protein
VRGQRYHITDLSKGAMLGKHAGLLRADRYDRWYPLLQEEIDLIAAPGACVIAVGKTVAAYLRRREFPREVTPVIHYSPLAGMARTARLQGHEDQFREFESSISPEAVLATAQAVLDESGVPPEIHKEALALVARSQLSEFRRKLVYCYKLDFEDLERRTSSKRTDVLETLALLSNTAPIRLCRQITPVTRPLAPRRRLVPKSPV